MSEEEDIRKFAEKHQLTFTLGKDNGIAEALGARTIPETIFINHEGEIIKKHAGIIYFDELKAGIVEIINGESFASD